MEKRERKRGTITKNRRPGCWIIRVYTGTKLVNGKTVRQSVSKAFKGTNNQASRELARMIAAVEVGTLLPPAKQTVASYIDGWLTDTAPRVAIRTMIGYRDMMTRYVQPVIGHLRLDKVGAADIRALYASMLTKGLTPYTVRKTHTTLKSVFQQAVADHILIWNPCLDQRLPKSTPKTFRILTVEEVGRIIAEAKDDRNYALWSLMLNTGMRPQEVLALKWDDLKDGKLTIERALVRVTAGTYTVGPTKTKKSRTISIPAATLADLSAYKTQQTTHILRMGSYYKRQGLIFATREGLHLSPMNMYTAWKRTLKRLSIPRTRLYDCRHTHASMLLAAGWPVKAVSERLGHASAKMTLDVYAHTLPNTDAETAAFFDRLIAPKAVAS